MGLSEWWDVRVEKSQARQESRVKQKGERQESRTESKSARKENRSERKAVRQDRRDSIAEALGTTFQELWDETAGIREGIFDLIETRIGILTEAMEMGWQIVQYVVEEYGDEALVGLAASQGIVLPPGFSIEGAFDTQENQQFLEDLGQSYKDDATNGAGQWISGVSNVVVGLGALTVVGLGFWAISGRKG